MSGKRGWLVTRGGRLMAVALLAVISGRVALADAWSESHSLEAQGKYAQAGALLEPLLDGSDSSDYAVLRYAWLFYLQGNYSDAVRHYRRALALNGDSIDARLGIALPLMAQKRWSEAQRFVEQVLEISPQSYVAHVRLMAIEEGLREWQKLIEHTKAFNRRYPSDSNGWVYQARAYLWLEKSREAESAYRQVLQRLPDHTEANRFLSGDQGTAALGAR